ncbi:MAG: alcohol dehydrogenase catalytic domain-containing protein [Lachnospiraceae bacterium]|jgi:L-iditol 2-dehydrogenase|nr:alcohol dehydrogenase catalytic domain-containing protein [Lachnospiraceae bacterium]
MKQAIMTEPGKIIYNEVPEPQPGAGQVKLKMERIGVCGSDIHVWHGKHPYTSYPVVQGHEVSAVVVETGSGVTEFAVGDRVTVMPQVVCKECYPCTHGMYNDCNSLKVMGFQTTGMASEYFVADAAWVLKLPEGLSADLGAVLEPLACGVHAVRRFGDVTGKKCVVLGGGTIGNLVGQALRAMGAGQVLLSEVSACRLEKAAACGLTIHSPAEKPLDEAIRDAFGDDGADVIFECIGNGKVLNQAVEIARKGSAIIVMGVVADPYPINMGLVQDHELSMIGTAMYRIEDWKKAIELVGQGLINLEILITHHVPFTCYEDAYRLIEEQKDKAMKVMIDM